MEICGNKMPTRCKRWFLLQILLLAQHVSGNTMPIIRSSRVFYRCLLPVVFGALVSNCRYGVELRVMCPVCELDALISQIDFDMKLYMFRTVRLSMIRSLFTVHSAMIYVIDVCRELLSRTRMELQVNPGSARKLSTNLCDIYHCWVYSE
jgi:hypothetical protein